MFTFPWRQPPASVLEPAGGLVFDWIVARGQLEFCTVGDVFRHAGHFGKMVSAADPQKTAPIFQPFVPDFCGCDRLGAVLFYRPQPAVEVFADPVWGGWRGARDVQLEVVLLNNLLWLVIALVGCLPIVPWIKEKWRLLSRPRWAAALESGAGMAWNLLLLFFCTAFLSGQSYNPFYYFRFRGIGDI